MSRDKSVSDVPRHHIMLALTNCTEIAMVSAGVDELAQSLGGNDRRARSAHPF